MPTVLITGANRGIGLEFARQYAADGWTIIATCRTESETGPIEALPGDIRIKKLDMTDWPALAGFGERLGGAALDVLICNAGAYGGEPDPETWLHTLAVNAIAPTLFARALADRIPSGGKAVAITSKMGSIADNTSGGSIVYRSSKAALNAAWRSLAIDWKNRISVALLHPGWVRTRMGGPNALITPEESVSGMRRVIHALGPGNSGAFMNHDGASIPW